MRFARWTALLVGLSATFAFSATAQDKGQDKKGSYTDPAKTDRDFAFQGEYVGEIQRDEGNLKVGAQVIALGDGKFQLVGLRRRPARRRLGPSERQDSSTASSRTAA